jgi:hypothetical protein
MNSSLLSSSFELLEDRIAPAGIITVVENAPGDFTLTGDLLDNAIIIFQTTPGSFRFEGFTGTVLDPGGVSSMDFTKLTKLTFIGNGGGDTLTINNVSTLSSLTMDGGGGADFFTATNVAIKGEADFSCGAGLDGIRFDGLTTKIGGNLKVTDNLDGMQLDLHALSTVIGGSLIVAGGTGQDFVFGDSEGTLNIGKGIDFDAGSAGGGQLALNFKTTQTIGKLPTGESVLFDAGADSFGLSILGGDSILTGGVRVTGSPQMDIIQLGGAVRGLKIGKLPTGESLAIDAGAGPDSVSINAASILFAGGIEFNGGAGPNSLNLASTNGKTAIGKLSTGHSIHYVGGLNSDFLSIDASILKLAGGIEMAAGEGPNSFALTAFGGVAAFGKLPSGASLKYTGGADADTINLLGAANVFAGGIDFAAGDGVNSISANSLSGSLRLGKLADGASLKYVGGSGGDTVNINCNFFGLAGGLDFSGGAGSNSVTLSGPNGKLLLGKLTTGQSVKYTGGPNDDTFTGNFAATTLAGGLEFLAGDGQNFATFLGSSGSLKIGKLASGQSIRYVGGVDPDGLSTTQANVVLAGGIEFTGGDGTSTVVFDNGNSLRIGTIATGQSILSTTGNGNDLLLLGRARTEFKGSIEMTGGDNANTIVLDGIGKVGKTAGGASILLDGGSGVDKIDIQDSITLAGSLSLTGAAGNDVLDLTDLHLLKAAGPITFNGGPDDDTLSMNVHSLALAQGINFTGNAGVDDFSLAANGTILGDVVADLGGAATGTQDATVTSRDGLVVGLFLKGKLTITGAATAASVDALSLLNVSVAREISVSLGDSISFVTIDNLIAGNTLTIDTGGGSDTVSFERTNFFGNSLIAKLATIQTGGGDDFVLIGSPTPLPNTGPTDSTRVRFLGGLTLDAGSGTDTRNAIDTENDFPGGPPTGFPTFEVTVP